MVKGADCLGRDAARELAFTVGLRGSNVPNLLKAVSPKLSDEDRKVVDNTNKLLAFLLGNLQVRWALPREWLGRESRSEPTRRLCGQIGLLSFLSSLLHVLRHVDTEGERE